MQLDCVERQAEAKALLGGIVGGRTAEVGTIDGIWSGASTAALAFWRYMKVSGNEVTHVAGTVATAGRSLSAPGVRVLTDLEWSDPGKMPNRICGETQPRTLVLALALDDPDFLQALFYHSSLRADDDALEQLGDACDRFNLSRIEGDWGALVNPSPDVIAVGMCSDMFGEEDTPALAECVALERDAILTTEAFLAIPAQNEAFRQCVNLLRGTGSMDFNPRYLYLSCARAEGRDEAVAVCVEANDVELTESGVLRSDDNVLAVAETQDCVLDRLGILKPRW